jgi:hypothetical protein
MQQISSGGIDLAFSMDGMWSVGPMVFPIVESGILTLKINDSL